MKDTEKENREVRFSLSVKRNSCKIKVASIQTGILQITYLGLVIWNYANAISNKESLLFQEEESVSEAAGLGNPSPFLFLPPALCDVTVSSSILIIYVETHFLNNNKKCSMLFVAIIFFMCQATSMMYVGLTMTSAAQFQMLRGCFFSI